jgi:hypothetical protein
MAHIVIPLPPIATQATISYVAIPSQVATHIVVPLPPNSNAIIVVSSIIIATSLLR